MASGPCRKEKETRMGVLGHRENVLKRQNQEASPGCPALLRGVVRSDFQVLCGIFLEPFLSHRSDHPVGQDPGFLV